MRFWCAMHFVESKTVVQVLWVLSWARSKCTCTSFKSPLQWESWKTGRIWSIMHFQYSLVFGKAKGLRLAFDGQTISSSTAKDEGTKSIRFVQFSVGLGSAGIKGHRTPSWDLKRGAVFAEVWATKPCKFGMEFFDSQCGWQKVAEHNFNCILQWYFSIFTPELDQYSLKLCQPQGL